MLYSLYGRGRPRMSRERYESLDRELLKLVADLPEHLSKSDRREEVAETTRGNFNRIRELEFILLDDVAEALLTNQDVEKSVPDDDPRDTVAEPTSLEFRWSEDSAGLEP